MGEYSSNSYQDEHEIDPPTISSQSNIVDQIPNSAINISKNSLEICQDISIELNNLEKEIMIFDGKKMINYF